MSLVEPSHGLPTLPPNDKSLPLLAWGSFAVGFWPVSIVIAYLERKKSPLFASQYRYLIRTFWIGFLYLAISTVLTLLFIGVLLFLATTIWFYARCIRAILCLLRNEPIPNPGTWLF